MSSSHKCHDQSCPFTYCKDESVLSSAFQNELRILCYIDVHDSLWSAFECIENSSLFKTAIRKSTLMRVAFFAYMRIEVGFDQGLTMNDINFKIVCKC